MENTSQPLGKQSKIKEECSSPLSFSYLELVKLPRRVPSRNQTQFSVC